MEVILCKEVGTLGNIGDVIKVKEGYARNFLLPKKLAYVASPANLRRIEREKIKKRAQEEQTKKEAEAFAEKLSSVSCTVAVEVNDLEKLYGSVTEIDIARALEAEGCQIDKSAIILENPIEELGIFEAMIKLHPEVVTKIRVWVTKK